MLKIAYKNENLCDIHATIYCLAWTLESCVIEPLHPYTTPYISLLFSVISRFFPIPPLFLSSSQRWCRKMLSRRARWGLRSRRWRRSSPPSAWWMSSPDMPGWSAKSTRWQTSWKRTVRDRSSYCDWRTMQSQCFFDTVNTKWTQASQCLLQGCYFVPPRSSSQSLFS